jgi:NAD(P)-dependent dehydrogenase (short-subunit alcohol dehydrogenase family)
VEDNRHLLAPRPLDRVWVIGGTSGIGKACVDVMAGTREAFGTDEHDADVRDPLALARVFQQMQPTHVVYSAGINKLAWIKQATPEEFLALLHVNVVGFQTLLTVLLGHSKKPIPVVAISSDAATRPMRTSFMYCASKAALDMAVKVAARELAPEGWRINAVAPGKVDRTGMTDYVDRMVPALRGWTRQYAEDYELSSTPIGRRIDPIEVAETVSHVLFGSLALNGAIVPVTGGR